METTPLSFEGGLSASEAAAELKTCRQTLYKWVKVGHARPLHRRPLMFGLDEVERLRTSRPRRGRPPLYPTTRAASS